jgi:hypothetical protein
MQIETAAALLVLVSMTVLLKDRLARFLEGSTIGSSSAGICEQQLGVFARN